ncbi:MAG: hypothetical protein NTV21_06660 [Planctomycetota bacterium]|nr:hypothetical protein [Planctomycetota bacterium]
MKSLWLALPLFLASACNCTDCGQGAGATATAPKGWIPGETNGAGKPASWLFVADPIDGEVLRVVSGNTGHTYNVEQSFETYGPDVEIVTRLRADGGLEDQGGGVLWRAKDANNYYLSRWNPLENNLRIYKVEAGKRTQLASISGELPGGWLNFTVTMKGASILVTCGTLSLGVEDTTFTEAGKVGLWTKADASTSFSLPKVRTL